MRDQRRSRGESHHNTNLTEEDVRMIRFMYHVLRPEAERRWKALTALGLAEKFGATEKIVRNIVQYQTWRHVPDDWSEK